MLKNLVQSDQLKAMKSGHSSELETLRYILSKIKNKEIDKQGDLEDNEIIDVLRRIAKELNESIESFEKGRRDDLASQSKAQLEIVKRYLPQELSDEKLKSEIKKIIGRNKELHEKNPKALIGVCVKELKGKADGSRIVKLLETL